MRAILKDGFGAQLGLISFSQLYDQKSQGEEQRLYFICSDMVWEGLEKFLVNYWGKYAYSHITNHHYPDSTNDLELARKLQKEFPDEDIYLLTPDLIGLEEFSIKKSNITWREIQANQCLRDWEKPNNNNVFLNLITAQPNNSYSFNEQLIKKLCSENLDYKFYYSDIKMWSNVDVRLDINLKELAANYPNFIVRHPVSFGADLMWIAHNINSFITLDSGIGNLAYRLGRDRILLDSRFNNLAFQIRWRGTTSDSIPINTSPAEISRLFKLFAKNPELTILNKRDLINIPEQQLFDRIGYKTKTKFND